MQPRIRDIEDSVGTCLRLVLAAHPSGALLTLERRDRGGLPGVMLSLHGAEVLAAFIMSARISLPNPVPDETTRGMFSAIFRLDAADPAGIWVEQEGSGKRIDIPANLWDRLYAELCLIIAHARELVRHASVEYH